MSPCNGVRGSECTGNVPDPSTFQPHEARAVSHLPHSTTALHIDSAIYMRAALYRAMKFDCPLIPA